MAVVPITFPDRQAAIKCSEALAATVPPGKHIIGSDEYAREKGARELRKCADRYGLSGELSLREVGFLADLRDKCPPRVRPLIDQWVAEGARREGLEATRLSPREIIARRKAQGFNPYKDTSA